MFKMFFPGFIVIVLLLVVTGEIAADDNCSQQIKDLGCVPMYADTLKSTNLQVEYAGKNISCGSTVNLLQSVNPPTLYYNAPSCCRNITVLAFIPHAAFSKSFTSWLVINVPPDNLRKGFTTPLVGNTKNNGYNAGSYAFPKHPGTSTGYFVYFVYCQCGYISDKTIYLEPTRGGFDIKGYAKKNHLGNPMAGFYHKFSESVIDTPGIVPKVSA